MKKLISIVAFVLLIGLIGFFGITRKQTENRNELLQQRMADIQSKLENAEQEKESLAKKIDAILTEDVYYFDAAAMMEEVKEIGELASVEYRYTNVGTLDASKKLFKTSIDIPGTKKSVVVSMDGILKVGIDVSEINIVGDDDSKTITVTMPKPRLLSNELIEDSIQVYDESSGAFSKITMNDSSAIRSQIKTKAEENAGVNGVYDQASKNAQLIIQSMLESIPRLKETYKIVFK